MQDRIIQIGFVTSDRQFIQDIAEILSSDYQPVFFDISKGLEADVLDEVLGISGQDVLIELVVIDADFFFCSSEGFVALCLNRLLGAGIPVFFRNNRVKECPLKMLWEIAGFGVQLFSMDNMEVAFSKALEERKFSIATLLVENEFSELYDEEELASPATLSAILTENEHVLMHVREYLRKNEGLVRIVDFGCGTGRVEEILMMDQEISQRISSIHAVDFAPAYLRKAKERLKYFLSEDAMKRIIFTRRIAEDTHLPANYFDIVIASFGVICFSQFHRTIPEIHRVLKSSGLVIMNGYNRDALAYDFNAVVPLGSKSLFTAYIDRDKNEMHLSDRVIKCFTFHINELVSFLKLVGLQPQIESIHTFPVLYGCMRKEYLQQLIPLHCEASSSRPVSYQSAQLETGYSSKGFSPTLHKLDADLAASLKNRGFYFSIAANKEII